MNSTVISAKTTIVSIPTLTEMAQCATAVLRAVLDSSEMMTAMAENTQFREDFLDEFFLNPAFFLAPLVEIVLRCLIHMSRASQLARA